MASGDTKTEALLNILGHGGTGDEYRGSGNTKTQNYILDAIDRINSLDPGGGGSDFNQLTNRPKYNGTAMTGDTDVTDEIVFLELTISDVTHIADGYIDFTPSMTISEIHTEFTNGKTVVARITIPTSVGVFSAGTYYFLPSFESSSWYFASGSAYNAATSEWLNFTYIQASATSRLYFKSDSGSGGGGVVELTSADYNYPADNPDGVAVWLLPLGLYKFADGVKVYHTSTASFTASTDNPHYLGVLMDDVGDITGQKLIVRFALHISGAHSRDTMQIYKVSNNGTSSDYQNATSYVLRGSDVYNGLDQTSGGYALDARQGKVLNDKITALEARIAALEGN